MRLGLTGGRVEGLRGGVLDCVYSTSRRQRLPRSHAVARTQHSTAGPRQHSTAQYSSAATAVTGCLATTTQPPPSWLQRRLRLPLGLSLTDAAAVVAAMTTAPPPGPLPHRRRRCNEDCQGGSHRQSDEAEDEATAAAAATAAAVTAATAQRPFQRDGDRLSSTPLPCTLGF